jgi:hypothetical protein
MFEAGKFSDISLCKDILKDSHTAYNINPSIPSHVAMLSLSHLYVDQYDTFWGKKSLMFFSYYHPIHNVQARLVNISPHWRVCLLHLYSCWRFSILILTLQWSSNDLKATACYNAAQSLYRAGNRNLFFTGNNFVALIFASLKEPSKLYQCIPIAYHFLIQSQTLAPKSQRVNILWREFKNFHEISLKYFEDVTRLSSQSEM